jgi:hypothetical protein
LHIHFNLGNPTNMGPRHRRTTENDGLLKTVGTNLLSCTAQCRRFRIDYHLTGFTIISLFYVHKFVLWNLFINSVFRASFHCVFTEKKASIVFCLVEYFQCEDVFSLHVVFFDPFITRVEGTHGVIVSHCADNRWSTWLLLILAVVVFEHIVDYLFICQFWRFSSSPPASQLYHSTSKS